MIVYCVALAEILFYLCAVPVHVAVYLQAGGGFHASAGFGLFEKRFAEKRAARQDIGSKAKRSSAFPAVGDARALTTALFHRHAGRLRITGRFSAGDAAATALIAGTMNSLEYALLPRFPNIILSLTPDFNASISYVSIHGIVSIRSGQIILAALSGAMKNSAGRIRQWINIP